jgi:hypothetical protein
MRGGETTRTRRRGRRGVGGARLRARIGGSQLPVSLLSLPVLVMNVVNSGTHGHVDRATVYQVEGAVCPPQRGVYVADFELDIPRRVARRDWD